MNAKLHILESIKDFIAKPSIKQFALSLLATTISIALTFGTAAIIDYNKKQADKREIVMMVMYDMYNTMKEVETADANLRQCMETQLQIAEDTTLFETRKFVMVRQMPRIEYTETVEQIFSSSIETINTLGNVLFVENVAQFYRNRKLYKESICDILYNDFIINQIISDMKEFVSYDLSIFALMSKEFKRDFRQLYVQCQQMMNVTDKQLETYRRERENLGNEALMEGEYSDISKDAMDLERRINEAVEKLDLN